MITDAILNSMRAFLDLIVAALPPWTITVPTGVISNMVGEITRWNNIAPVLEVFSIVGLTFGLVLAMIAVKWMVKLVDWVRG